MSVINVYKPLGWTPLQTLEHLRVAVPSLRDHVMTYAGRLDPMAEGVLIVLTNEDRLRAATYQKLPKSYTATMLFGFSSDTYDALGLVTRGASPDVHAVQDALCDLVGEHLLPLPPYSAYKVQGKPLHWWAQQGRLHEIVVPRRAMRVTGVSAISVHEQPPHTVLDDVCRRIVLVEGSFRQDAIRAQWKEILTGTTTVLTAELSLDVTSGTYIRALAEHVGATLGCGALLLKLTRTRVGDHSISDALRLTA